MNINIKAHFDEEKKKHQELVAKAKSEKEKLQKNIALKTETKAKLEAEKKKKEALLGQNEEEGLDVAKLKEKLRELDSQIALADTDIEALKKAEQKSDAVLSRSFQREDLMVSVLKNVYHSEEAVVVERFEDVFALLPVVMTELDKAGRPTKCEVRIVPEDSRALSIKPSEKHFWKNFRPESLRWLPTQQLAAEEQQAAEDQREQSNHGPRIRAFFETGTRKFLLSKTAVDWRVNREKQQQYGYGQKEYVTDEYEDDFSDIAVSLGASMDVLLKAENGQTDLNKTYEKNPLLARVRSEVVKQTTRTPLFKECTEHLTSDEIYQRIKPEWDGFKNCAWSGMVSGVLALLKYHVENGERARFWSGAFEGQYGFRLRTRDHTWIVGQLYLDASDKSGNSKKPIQVHPASNRQYGEGAWQVASVGGLFIRVAESQE